MYCDHPEMYDKIDEEEIPSKCPLRKEAATICLEDSYFINEDKDSSDKYILVLYGDPVFCSKTKKIEDLPEDLKEFILSKTDIYDEFPCYYFEEIPPHDIVSICDYKKYIK